MTLYAHRTGDLAEARDRVEMFARELAGRESVLVRRIAEVNEAIAAEADRLDATLAALHRNHAAADSAARRLITRRAKLAAQADAAAKRVQRRRDSLDRRQRELELVIAKTELRLQGVSAPTVHGGRAGLEAATEEIRRHEENKRIAARQNNL